MQLDDQELTNALNNMFGEAIEVFNDMQQQTDQQLKQVEGTVEEFIEVTSDRLAGVLNPQRIQREVADRTVKKLTKYKADWKPFDYGLSEISGITNMLKSPGLSPELLPSDSYSQSQQTQTNGSNNSTHHNGQSQIPQQSTAIPVEVTAIEPEKPSTTETMPLPQNSSTNAIDPVEQLRKARFGAKPKKSANPTD